MTGGRVDEQGVDEQGVDEEKQEEQGTPVRLSAEVRE